MNDRDRTAIHRVLDANANRAREALRVAEEAARFALERPDLAEAAKAMRHDLRAALDRFGIDALVLARDTAGDVGTRLSTPAEGRRGGTADIARAAMKRLTEALRAIEEYGKALDAPAAAAAPAVEAIRYRAYDLERRLAEALRPASRLAAGGLCVLLTESLCARPWEDVLAGALAGGAAVVQVREKAMADGALLARARRVADACHRAGALCIINDRTDVAVLAAADGVHVGADDLPPAAARRIVGPDRLVGTSTHSLPQALAAAETGPDYIACGPMFQSTTKPQAVIPGPALCREVTARVGLPVMAIGGITSENAAEVLAAGARWLAVSAAVCAAADPEAAARRLIEIVAACEPRT